MAARTDARILLVLGLAAAASEARSDNLHVVVTFSESSELISPVETTTNTVFRTTATLFTSGSVISQIDRATGQMTRQNTETLKLGQSAGGGVSWHVNGANELIGMTKYLSGSRAIRVVVDGSTCRATVGYNLEPGARTFRYRRMTTGGEGVSRQIRADNVSCTIGD